MVHPVRAFLAAALLLGHAALALAQTDTLFGPRLYERVAGKPAASTDTFTVPDRAAPPYTLRVQNGVGRAAVEAAWIFVNGTQVMGPEALHPKVTDLVRTVQLKPENTLVVILAGRPNTHLTVTIAGQLVPPKVVSFTPASTAVTLGASTKLSLAIAPVQETDTVVALETTPAGVALVPESVTVPANQASVDVPVGSIAFGQAGVTARLNGSTASALVNIVPQSLQVTSLAPSVSTLSVNATGTFTVSINAVQDVDKPIALSADPAGVLELPASVTVPSGTTSAVFTAKALAVGDAVVTAAANGTQQTARVHVSPEPAAIVSLLPNPLSLQQGATSTLAVTINVAQEADTIVGVSSDAPDVVQVPSAVTIPAGSVSASILVVAATAGTANVTATVNGSSAAAAVRVNPPPPVVTELAPATLSLAKGTPGMLTVRLSRAPSEPTAVTLSSTFPETASVPPTVTVPAGETSASFPVASNGQGQATIRATLNEGTASATVTVTDAEVTALTINPPAPTIDIGQIFPFAATATMTDGTLRDFTAFVSWTTDDSNVATIQASGSATGVAPGATAVRATYNFVQFATGVTMTVAAETTITVRPPPPPPPSLSITGPATIPTGLTSFATVFSSVPAPAGGLTITLQKSGIGVVNIPASIFIPETASAAGIPISALAVGPVTITASAPGFVSGSFGFTVVPGLTITSISPTSGTTGTTVTISGSPFDVANTTVFFPPGVAAPIVSITQTQLVVTVPAGATTGPILVSGPGGSAQSAPFTVVAPPAPTHAHITDRVGRSSSPVTPFVLDSNPGDAFTFQVLGQPAIGTAAVVDNRLVYTPNGGTGLDQFPYRVVRSNGSTIDGTARVRVYGGTNAFTACTRNSTTVTNPDGSVSLTRTQAANCSFYAEVATRATATGVALVKYIVARPSLGTLPKAAVFLIGGSDLDTGLVGDPVTGNTTAAGGNFLVRTAQIYAEAGYLAIAMSRPSDVPAVPVGDIDRYRVSVKHAIDILNILREENSDNLPIFIAGTSRGAMSVVANNLIATGISISSPVTRASPSDPSLLFVNDPRFASLQPAFVQRPAHVLWNTSDLCGLTRPVDSQALFNNLLAAGVTAASDAVSGGFAFDNGTGIDQCGGLSPHGYLGIEQILANGSTGAAQRIAAWLDSRVAALGADRHPDASFASFSTTPGVPLSIDLAALARDLDGDPLAYQLSHATTALGGAVSLSGSMVTYTPPAGITSGTDSFVYVVTDGRGGVGAAVVSVKIAAPVLTALSLAPQSASIVVGQTQQFNATGTLSNGSTLNVNTLVSWLSTNPGVASIDASGLVTALVPGVTTIAARYPATGPAAFVELTTLTVSEASPLVLAGPNPVMPGITAAFTLSSSVPAPPGGLLVTLSASGPAPISVPSSVVMPANSISVNVFVVATTAGTYTITASAPNRLPGSFTFTVMQGTTVTSISPTSGPAGTVVTITGGPFDPNPANDLVSFAGATAPILSVTPTQITASVPNGALTGPVAVNVLGVGLAQGPTFVVLPPPPAPTHAHIVDRNGRTSSPVTPFVIDSNPGDAFTFQVLGQPALGTAAVVDNRLVYTPNGTTGLDQFPYRVTKSDGSTIDGTARVRVYGGTNAFTSCTRNSATVTNPDGTVSLTRTQSANCTFYAEVVTRIAPTAVAKVKYIVARPSLGTLPKAAVFLIGGGDLDFNIAGDPVTGNVTSAGSNFLVRTAQIFAEAGYLAIAMNRPSDLPAPGSTITVADVDRYRVSVRHAVDILAVLREENSDNLPIFIAGTSRGAMSVVANNLIATGISISSPVTLPSTDPAQLYLYEPGFPSLQPAFVQRPAHVLWNTSDICFVTSPANSQQLYNDLVAAGVPAASDAVAGGFAFDGGTGIDQCSGQSPHGYLGIEQTLADGTPGAAQRVTAWLDSRVAALGADRHPDAAFATFATAAGAPVSIDLAALSRDLDGDPLAYQVSHASSALGGGVSLSGSTVTYTPPAGVASGTDYFVYVVTDGRGGVGAAVITVKIGN